MNAMISVGSHRLDAWMVDGPTEIPFGAFRSTVETQIASSSTGKAQITSISRETSASSQPPWNPARSAKTVARMQQMTAEPMPDLERAAPAVEHPRGDVAAVLVGAQEVVVRVPGGADRASRPRCRMPPPCCISATRLPFTMVWPFRLFWNGLTWAMWSA